jgi:hypothetical protein
MTIWGKSDILHPGRGPQSVNAMLVYTFRKKLGRARKKLPFAAAVIVVVLFSEGHAAAVEKYWIAHEASLIVVGTLHPQITFPWLDGWHYVGTIDVDEVLFGSRPPAKLTYRFVCPYGYCQTWWAPGLPAFYRAKGMWFLVPIDERSWCPSSGFGFVALSGRADYEGYIRRHEQISSH